MHVELYFTVSNGRNILIFVKYNLYGINLSESCLSMRKGIFFVIRISRLKLIVLIAMLIVTFLFYTVIIKSSSNIVYQPNTFSNKPQLAIIIDDFGQNQNGVKEMMEIDRHLTFAVMPFLEFSEQDAVEAHNRGFEVIVHLPMQSHVASKEKWLGPRPVHLDSSDEEIRNIVLDSINSIPYAVGVNIHMGCLASENERIMTSVMSTVKEKNLYFVDSRTSSKTVCREVAQKVGVQFAERNVFLEHSSKAKDYIKKQLSIAGDVAIKKGYAVAIGHVGAVGGNVTAEAIKEMIPELEEKGIEFIFVSELIYKR